MNGQQRFLHNIVYEIGSYSFAARHPCDEGYAVAQQRFVDCAIAGLGGDHPSRPPTINFLLRGRFRIHSGRSNFHRRSIHRSYGHIRSIKK